MKIVFAQGNPGSQYSKTRHNVGFIILDALAEKAGLTWRVDKKSRAEITETSLGSEKVLLVKPLSFYNETGQVARSFVDFYKLSPASDVLVIHDELALPFGTIRIRQKGSDAGNNGIKSLNAHLGDTYTRIRVGIWNERRDTMDDAAFVLSNFTQDEQEIIKSDINHRIESLIESFVNGSLDPHSFSLEV